MAKSKETSQVIRSVDLHTSGSARDFQIPEVSSVQIIIHKYKHHGNVLPPYHSGRRRFCVLESMCIWPRTKAADLRVFIHRETSPGPTWTQRTLREDRDITPKATQETEDRHTGTKRLMFGDMVWWNWTVHVHRYTWRTWGSWEHYLSCEARGWQHHVAGLFRCRRDRCTSFLIGWWIKIMLKYESRWTMSLSAGSG